jgi:hypothetical protein
VTPYEEGGFALVDSEVKTEREFAFAREINLRLLPLDFELQMISGGRVVSDSPITFFAIDSGWIFDPFAPGLFRPTHFPILS